MAGSAAAQTPAPTVVDPKLEVGQVVSGLTHRSGSRSSTTTSSS
jgi:hypothetical protein